MIKSRYTFMGFVLLVGFLLSWQMAVAFDVNTMLISFNQPDTVSKLSLNTKDCHAQTFSYRVKFNQFKVAMISGRLADHDPVNTVRGLFNIMQKDGCVISVDTAESYFGHVYCIGEKFFVLEHEYHVVGVVGGSTNVYIPYNEALITRYPWSMQERISLDVKNQKLESWLNTQNSLLTKGAYLKSNLIYRDYIAFFLSASLIMVVAILLVRLLQLTKNIITTLQAILNTRAERKYGFKLDDYWQAYPKTRKTLFLNIAKCFGFIIGVGLCVKYIYIPTTLIPSNFLSPLAYLKVVANLIQQTKLGLASGFYLIQVYFIGYLAIYILAIISFVLLSKRVERIIKSKNKLSKLL